MKTKNIESDGRFRSLNDCETIFFKRVHSEKFNLDKPIYHYYILHDLFDYHEKYVDLVDFLIGKNSESTLCSLIDLPGFGMSTGIRGHVKDLDDYSLDFTHFFNINFFESKNVSERKIIIAQGLGGLVVLNSILNEKFNNHFMLAAVVLSNPFIKLNPKKFNFKNINLLTKSDWISKLKVKNPFNITELISDLKKCESFVADSLIEDQFSAKLIEEIINKGNVVRKLSYFLEIPTFFLLSKKNEVIDVESAQLFIKGVDEKYRKIKKYNEMKYNLFNDENRLEVFNDIYSWLGEKI